MSYTSQITITCDYCGKKETTTGTDIDKAIHNLTQKGWKDYDDTDKQYCSRTCSANDRTITYTTSNQIKTTP